MSTPDHWGFYPYPPSTAGAVIALITLVCLTLYHLFQFIRFRAWVLFWLILGALLECVGFLGRAWSVTHDTDVLTFLVGYLVPIIAPSLLAAACYMVFGRVVWAVTPPENLKFRVLLVSPRWITPTFVAFDLASFFIQLVGIAGIAGSIDPKDHTTDATKAKHGQSIVKFGLILQIVCFGLFTLIGINFLVRSRSWPSPEAIHWKKLAWAVNAAATLIMLRAFYRIFEFSTSNASQYLSDHEWCFYVFDVLPIFCSIALFNIFHPGRSLPRMFNGLRLNKKALLQQKQADALRVSSGQAYMPPPYEMQPQVYQARAVVYQGKAVAV